jgi:two-component system sensor histidine kinase DegS
MLILSRKVGEVIVIGERVQVSVRKVRSKSVSLGITAPEDVRVDRGEIHVRKNAESDSVAEREPSMAEQGSRVQERQCETMVHEIHDGPCQYVISAKMFFEAFRQGAGEATAGDWGSFERGMTLLSRAVDELHRFIDGRRPPHLDGNDLLTAIGRLVAEVQACGGPEIEFCHDFQDYAADPLPVHLELAVFRIVQQCVINAWHHSKSKRMLVGLSRDDKSLSIQAQDWGIGFDPAKIWAKGFGLEGIWRRADLLGGTAIIQSSPGEGTCITVELPLVAPPRLQPRSERDARSLCFMRS